jgi:hypothetical protein
VVLRCGIFLGKWRSSFAGSSGGRMNVQSACALNTLLYAGHQIVFADSENKLHRAFSTLHIIAKKYNL